MQLLKLISLKLLLLLELLLLLLLLMLSFLRFLHEDLLMMVEALLVKHEFGIDGRGTRSREADVRGGTRRGGGVLRGVVRRIERRLLDGSNSSERMRGRSEILLLLLSSHLFVPPQSSDDLLPLNTRLALVHLLEIDFEFRSSTSLFDRDLSIHRRRLVPRFERIHSIVRPDIVPRRFSSAEHSVSEISESFLEILERSNQRQFRFGRRRRGEKVRVGSTNEFVRSVTGMKRGREIRSRIKVVARNLLRVEDVALLFRDESLLVRLGVLRHLAVERTPAGGGFVPSERLRRGNERGTDRLRSVEGRRSGDEGCGERGLHVEGVSISLRADCDARR